VTPTPGPAVAGFYTLVPCRVADTRATGSALAAGAPRDFVLVGQCGITPEATSVSLNLTVTQPTELGHITVYPSGTPQPLTSMLNYRGGQTRANNAIVTLGVNGAISVVSGQSAGTTHFIIDVNGYFRSPK
jgi:hypothetical protein